jgi:arylsulfatase A-like enzyme
MNLTLRRLGVWFAGCLLAALACAGRDPQPNVIIIGVDSLRPDHLGCYGYGRGTSPAIDGLARSGTLAEQAISQAAWTTASFGTILTSLYPSQHGADGLSRRMRTSFPTLASLLKAEGYSTGAVVNAPLLSPSFGLDRGFDSYDAGPERGRTADETTADALRWLDTVRASRFLLFVHYFEPHVPYAPPAPFDTLFDAGYHGALADSVDLGIASADGENLFEHLERLSPADWAHIQALYDGEVATVDRAIGALLEGLRARRLDGRTLIVLLADHGEEFCEHGGFEHGHSLHGEVVRVPLIFALPGRIGAGRRLARQVRLLDVTPTVLDLAGVPIPEQLEGASLAPLITGDGEPRSLGEDLLPPEAAYSESLIRGSQRMSLTVEGWKVIYGLATDRSELYNLAKDPGEVRDIADREPEKRRALEEMLARTFFRLSDTWYIEMAGGPSSHTFSVSVTPERGRILGGIAIHRFFGADGRMTEAGPVAGRSRDGQALEIAGLEVASPLKLAFKVDPQDFPVTFDLRLDGSPATANTYLGQGLARPDEMPITQRPKRAGKRSLGEPAGRPTPPYLLVWRWESPYKGETAAALDEATKSRLRALGYIQ